MEGTKCEHEWLHRQLDISEDNRAIVTTFSTLSMQYFPHSEPVILHISLAFFPSSQWGIVHHIFIEWFPRDIKAIFPNHVVVWLVYTTLSKWAYVDCHFSCKWQCQNRSSSIVFNTPSIRLLAAWDISHPIATGKCECSWRIASQPFPLSGSSTLEVSFLFTLCWNMALKIRGALVGTYLSAFTRLHR